MSGCSSNNGRLRMPSSNVAAAHLVGPAAWHAGNERRCLASGRVRETAFVQARDAIGDPSGCGAERPFVVSAAAGGAVALRPSATLRCPMIQPVERWLQQVVEPAAERYFGQRVREIRVVASYACRSRNSLQGAKLSEHGRANALDIAAFRLEDGQVITVKHGWSGFGSEGRFLRTVHRGACGYFTTVLGPESDRFHHDHFHLDLARHGRSGDIRVCR
jgi:hypothetical protein